MRISRTIFLYLGVAQTVHWIGLYYVFPALTGEIATGIGSPPQVVQMLFSVSLLVCACCSPFTTALFRRDSPQSVLSVANILSMVTLLLLAGATALAPAVIAAFLLGALMSVLLYDGAFVAVSRFDRSTRTRAIGWIVTGGGMATIIAIPILNLAAHHIGWRFALLVVACASAVLAAIAQHVRWPGPSPTDFHSEARPPRRWAGRPEIWAFGLGFGITNAALVGVLSVLLHFVALHGFSSAQGAWVVATWGIASMPARLLISMRQCSGLTVANVALGCGFLGFLVFLHSGRASAAIGLVMFGACSGLLTASRALVTSEFIFDLPFEASNGILATFSNSLRILGPVAAAKIVYSVARPARFLIGSAVTVLAAAVLINVTCEVISRRKGERCQT